jgi:hypothetical protein
VIGAVLVLLALFLVGPFAVFVTGAIWSLLMGQVLSDDADARAAGTPQDSISAA